MPVQEAHMTRQRDEAEASGVARWLVIGTTLVHRDG
jgi:hypothetical protein